MFNRSYDLNETYESIHSEQKRQNIYFTYYYIGSTYLFRSSILWVPT